MNDIQLDGDIVSVVLPCGTRMLVDVHTWERMKGWTWKRLKGRSYAYTSLGNTVLAHRFILNARPGQQVDHINGNGLDNRLCNLRFSTQSQNRANAKPRSPHGFKGIYFNAGKWQSMMRYDGKRYYMGRYKDQVRAARAYDRAALALAGEFAALNFEQDRATYRPRMPRECSPR